MKQQIIRLALLVLIAAGPATVCSALDLTPTPVEYTNEGITFRQLVFQDGDRRISYEPPQNWSHRGSAESLHLSPPNNSRGQAVIETSSLPGPAGPFDAAAVALLKQEFLNSIPATAQSVEVTSETPDALPITGARTYEFTASYQALGETYLRSTIFVNLPNVRLICRFSAPKAEFEKLYRAFRGSLLSWQPVEPAAQ